MDFLVPESRRSLAKNLPRVFETELKVCDAVLEDEGDKSFQCLVAIRACGLFGVETLSPAGSSSARFVRFERGRRLAFLDAAVLTHQLPEFTHSDNPISSNKRGTL